jgi:hypothetical protein
VQDGQEPVNPSVDPGLTQAEEFAHERLQGVSLQVDQDEQQFLLGAMQRPGAAATREPLPRLAGHGFLGRMQPPIAASKGGQQGLKLRHR